METDPERLATALVSRPPSYLSQFERIVGPIKLSFRDEHHENIGFLRRPADHRPDPVSPIIQWLSVRYAFDVYHEDRRRERDVALLEYTLALRCDRAMIERVLGRHFGSPRFVFEEREALGKTTRSEYAVYHPFYVDVTADRRPNLQWHADMPRFAIPVPDETARRAWLGELRRCCEGAMNIDEIDAFCRTAPAHAGITIAGTLNSTFNPYAEFRPATSDARDYSLRLVPPIRAKVLAEIFGWGDVIGSSHDVHMSSWHIEPRGRNWLPVTGALQHWEIEAMLTSWPSGPSEPAFRGNVAHAIGDADEVRVFAIRPRFR